MRVVPVYIVLADGEPYAVYLSKGQAQNRLNQMMQMDSEFRLG